MATERKPFCRIETSLFREPWPDDLKLALVRLVMFMCDRWARDRLTTDEAIRATLNKAQVAEISGKHRPDVASKLLQRLADVASISIERRGDFTSIYWPKLAETQGWASRDRAIAARKRPQSAPAPAQAPAQATKEGQEKAASPPTTPPEPTPDPAPIAATPAPTGLILYDNPEDPLALVPDAACAMLARLLAKRPGTFDQKVEFLRGHLDLMVAELEIEGQPTMAKLKRLVFRWYNRHLESPQGRHRSWAEKDADSIKRELFGDE
jgi:hypothetical protein